MDSSEVDILTTEYPYSDWMRNLADIVHTVPLCQIAIPGSHDSGTMYLDASLDFAPDAPSVCKHLPQCIKKIVKNAAKSWSVCQDQSFSHQLQSGIRYLDLRLAKKPGTADVYIVHALYGQEIELSLNEIAGFLKDHKQEVVLLDFNHFYAMNDEDHSRILNLLKEVFGDTICPYQKNVGDVTLNFLWGKKWQVIVFYHNEIVSSQPLFWPGSCIPSPWPNTTKTASLLKTLEKNFNKGHSSEEFYVTQGVLTPTNAYFLAHMSSSLKNILAKRVAKPYTDWLQTKHAGHNGINVCIMDFVEMANYIPIVINLNNHINQF